MHDTGYFSALPSLEEYWQQVTSWSVFLNIQLDRSPRAHACMEVAWNVCNFRETCFPLTAACGRANVKVVYATPRLILWKSSNEFPCLKNRLACVCRGSYASSLNDR